MKNKFTDPTIITRKKSGNEEEIPPERDVAQQEKLNRQVEKKFARVTAHSSQFKRNYDPLSLNKRHFKK